MDTEPASLDGGNDFQILTFDYWSVLINMRGDAVENGKLSGFYEIQLRHTGNALQDPEAPVVRTFLFYSDLEPGLVLTDMGSALNPMAQARITCRRRWTSCTTR